MSKRTLAAIAAASVIFAAMSIAIAVLRAELRSARSAAENARDAADAAEKRAVDADARTRAAMEAAARAVAAADDLVLRQKEAYEKALSDEFELEGVDHDWMACPLPPGVRNAVRAVHEDENSAGDLADVRDTDGGCDGH